MKAATDKAKSRFLSSWERILLNAKDKPVCRLGLAISETQHLILLGFLRQPNLPTFRVDKNSFFYEWRT
jgi:hypothetical protein